MAKRKRPRNRLHARRKAAKKKLLNAKRIPRRKK